MAKLEKSVVAPLIKSITAKAESSVVERGEHRLKLYYLDDITLTFRINDKPSFFGLVFEVLGRDFTLLSSLELMVSGDDEEGRETVFVVEDPGLISMISEYIDWRARILAEYDA